MNSCKTLWYNGGWFNTRFQVITTKLKMVTIASPYSLYWLLHDSFDCSSLVIMTTSHRLNYHIAGFVCEVLICANHASCHELSNFNSAHFRFSSLHVSLFLTCTCDYFILCLCSNTSREDTSALLPNPKGLRIAMGVWIMYTMTLQHFSNVANSRSS